MTLELVTCPNCGSKVSRTLYKKFDLPIARCVQCSLVFANPRLPADDIWERYSADYFRNEYLPALGVHNGKYSLKLFDERYSTMLGLISDCVQPPARMLEVGCGEGFFLKSAERAGWGVEGIELSKAAADFARLELGLQVSVMDAEEMRLAPEGYDVAILFETIEHLLDPVRVLTKIRRGLRYDGLLVISTPNFNALSRSILGAQWSVLSPAEHLYYFTEATLRQILHNSGFDDIRVLRNYSWFEVFDSMKPQQTHNPKNVRAVAYELVVRLLGRILHRPVQAAGKGGTLLCFSRAI